MTDSELTKEGVEDDEGQEKGRRVNKERSF